MKNQVKELGYEYKITSVKKENSGFERVKIRTSNDVNEFARKFYHEDLGIYESVFAIALNASNEIISWMKISQGGVRGSVIDPVIVAKHCVDILASGCILVHNHPSGSLKPSPQDKKITKKVKSGLEFLEIKLLDHLIITENDYYSFLDDGEMY